jgi:hypothetical protein
MPQGLTAVARAYQYRGKLWLAIAVRFAYPEWTCTAAPQEETNAERYACRSRVPGGTSPEKSESIPYRAPA